MKIVVMDNNAEWLHYTYESHSTSSIVSVSVITFRGKEVFLVRMDRTLDFLYDGDRYIKVEAHHSESQDGLETVYMLPRHEVMLTNREKKMIDEFLLSL